MTALPARLMPVVGAALGDALGAGVEGGQALARAIREDALGVGRRFWPYSPFGFAPGEITDDTQMALAAIVALHGERPDVGDARGRAGYLTRVGGAYRAWYRSHPPDVGTATAGALRIDAIGGGFRSWGGGESAGNGSLMRATAPFTAGYRGTALLIAAALDSAITHPDPRCVLACVWYAATLEAAADSAAPDRLRDAMRTALTTMAAAPVESWLADLGATEPAAWSAFRAKLADARGIIATTIEQALAGEHVDCLTQPHTSWPTGFVIDSLRQAAWAAFQGATSDEPLRLAVLHGGRDADTIAAIAGGLIGARFGRLALDHWSPALLSDLRLGHTVAGFPAGTAVLDVLAGAVAPTAT